MEVSLGSEVMTNAATSKRAAEEGRECLRTFPEGRRIWGEGGRAVRHRTDRLKKAV